MSRRVKIPYHIPGGSSGFLWMDVDTTGGVSMPSNATNASGSGTSWLTGSGAPSDGSGVNGDFYIDTLANAYYGPKTAGTWSGTGPNSFGAGVSPLTYERFVTPGSATFTYTDTTRIIYVSGCSGGGGGGGGYNGVGGGGGGGGPAPMYFMLPLELNAGGGQLDIFIGSGGIAGTVGNSGGDGTETTIVGHTATEILSPYANASNQIMFGYGFGGIVGTSGAGGNGSGAIIASTAFAHYGTENTGTAHASRWWYTADGFPSVEWLLPICQGAGGGAASANGGSRNLSGFSTINGMGFGNSGTGNASGGGGGGGGGGPYGRGGLGGSNAGAAGTGLGFGFGGGGGSGNAAGTAGGNGFLMIWY